MKSTGNKLAILAILFLGLFLRIYHLSNESIWYDEALSIKVDSSSLLQLTLASNSHLYHILLHYWVNLFGDSEFATRFLSRIFGFVVLFYSDIHPPLYHILLHYWINLFGDSEFSVRFLSVIFGFFAIFMIYKVGSLIFDKEVGILSSLMLGLSVDHISYSQEARMYSLMPLLTLLSIYFFIRLLKERGFIVLIGYILSSILLMYTHVYGLFIIIAQNIYIVTLLLFSKEDYELNFRVWILLQAILIALFTPWMGALIKRIMLVETITDPQWIEVVSIYSIVNTFMRYSNYSNFLFFLFMILLPFSVVTYEKTKGSIYWKDLFKAIKSRQLNIRFSNPDRIYLLSLWLLTPIILPFIISRFSTPIYKYRYTLGASLAFYLLVAAGIRNIGYKYVKLAIIGIFIVFSLVNVREYYATIKKEQWREVANYIDTNAEHGDLLIFCSAPQQTPFDYYSKRTDLSKRGVPQKGLKDVDEENIKELGTTVRGYNRAWIILSLCRDDSKGLIKKTLSESYNLTLSESYNLSYGNRGIEVDLFEKK